MLVNWILSRLCRDDTCTVEVNFLYDSFLFEGIESGQILCNDKPGMRAFVENLNNLFPQITRIRADGKTLYRGIAILPLKKLDKDHKGLTTDELLCSLPSDIKQKEVHVTETSVRWEFNTAITSNGYCITKTVDFHLDGTWSLLIGSKIVELQNIYVSNRYELNNMQLIHDIAKKIKLCSGVIVAKSVIITRYQTLEILKHSEEAQGLTCLRSLNCERVVPFNTSKTCCKICKRMTFKYNSSVKENTPSTEIVESPTVGNSDTASAEELKRILPEASSKMVCLILEQAKNLRRNPKGRRWSKECISICLQIFNRSPQAYDILRQSGILILPSPSLLILYKNSLKQEIGFHEDTFLWMYNEAKRKNIKSWSGGIIFDEMSIQGDLQITKNGDGMQLVGFTKLNDEAEMCYTMRKGIKDKVIGTHVLQLLFLGISGFRFPFAHFVTDCIQAAELHNIFWEAVDKLSMFGFDVLYTCMDGAQCNRSFMKINLTPKPKTFTVTSRCTLDKLVFIMDVSHVLKKIRNNILKSGIHTKNTRLLTLPSNYTIQWQMFIDCYNWDRQNCLQLHKTLSNEHIYPDQQLKMRNYLAEDVLNNEMLNLMKQYQISLGEKGNVLCGVVEFLEQTAKIVSIFRDMRPIKSAEDERLNELKTVNEWFQLWENIFSNKGESKNLMSHQCCEDIHSCLIGFIELCRMFFAKKINSGVYIVPALVNSDVIENNFNQQRSTYNGANSNPNVLQYQNTMNSIIIGQNTISRKSNAWSSSHTQSSSAFESLPVPLRKRKTVYCDNRFTEIKVKKM